MGLICAFCRCCAFCINSGELASLRRRSLAAQNWWMLKIHPNYFHAKNQFTFVPINACNDLYARAIWIKILASQKIQILQTSSGHLKHLPTSPCPRNLFLSLPYYQRLPGGKTSLCQIVHVTYIYGLILILSRNDTKVACLCFVCFTDMLNVEMRETHNYICAIARQFACICLICVGICHLLGS